MRERIIEYRRSIKNLDWMGSRSHDLGAKVRMLSLTVDRGTFSSEEKVLVVFPVTSVEVEVRGSEAV